MDTYKIGDILLHWDSEYTLAPGRFMELFRHENTCGENDIYLKGRIEPLEQYTAYPLLESKGVYDLYDVNGERLLLYHWGYHRNAYGVWVSRIQQSRADACSFDPRILDSEPIHADWFLGVCGLQKALLQRGCPVLHASFVEHKGQAILFTAPSETGKSTQANLWRQYAGARIINGDRVLLGRRGDTWYAHGFPACGSSNICENRSVPLGAIVVLSQSKENRVIPMPAAQKIKSLVSGMVLYAWNGPDLDMTLELAQDIANKIPIVQLACRPDKEAVEVLGQYLENMK